MNTTEIIIEPHPQQLARLVESAMRLAPYLMERLGEGPLGSFLTQTVDVERTYLLHQIAMWLLRGASIDDIRCHVATGDNLPFEGCEHAMYGSLLGALAERVDGMTETLQSILDLTAFIDEAMNAIQTDSGLTRTDMLRLLRGEERPYVRCSHFSAA